MTLRQGTKAAVSGEPNGSEDYSLRWSMLVIIGLGYFTTLLNLVGISAAFPKIATEFGADYQEVALLVTAFLAGLASGHIPSGLLSARIGMRRVLIIGMLVQAIAACASGFAGNYIELAMCRFVVGLGASAFASVAVGAISVWFEKYEITLALGIGVAANSLGTATGLYAGTYAVQAFGWRGALIVGGIIGAASALTVIVGFCTPRHISTLGGTKVTLVALRQVLGNRQVWIYGMAFVGAYGGYMATIHLIRGYATFTGYFSPADAGLVAACIGLSGIPGSIFGGWLADRSKHCRRLMIGPMMIMAGLFAMIPFLPPVFLWAISICIGFLMQFISAVWSSVPRRFAGIAHEHVATAMGLLLTIGAFGGFVIPAIFGDLVKNSGFTAGWVFLGIAAAAFALIGFLGADVASSAEGDTSAQRAASAAQTCS